MQTQVVSGDQPDEFGAWQEIIRATERDARGYTVQVWVSAGQRATVEVGIGHSGRELPRGENELEATWDGDRPRTFVVPHDPVRAGTKMAMRVKSPQAGSVVTVDIMIHED